MFIIVMILIVLALLFGPQWWARAVLRRYSKPRDDLDGTGGELAVHLLQRLGIDNVDVETTTAGDHYDPHSRTVRLTAEHMQGRSLTAVVVAAHEVGHAMQDFSGYAPLKIRTRLVALAQVAEKAGSFLLVTMPIVTLLVRVPMASLIMLLAGLASLGVAALVHLVTLPVEFDASFGRAMPVLEAGRYLPDRDMPAARKILQACAMTYLAASLGSLLNLWRWIAILRR